VEEANPTVFLTEKRKKKEKKQFFVTKVEEPAQGGRNQCSKMRSMGRPSPAGRKELNLMSRGGEKGKKKGLHSVVQ